MAYLKKLPTYFVKGGDRRAAYYTVQARELQESGYVEEGERAEIRKPAEKQPEILVEAGASAYDSTESLTEPLAKETDLDAMTKAELLDYALDRGVDLKNSLPKVDVLKACKEIKSL